MGFTALKAALAEIGIFTVAIAAEGTGESFESLPVIRDHTDEAGREVGSSKARRGRYIAEKYSAPEEIRILLEQVRTSLG
jgi:hypothetical protein